MSDSTQPFQPGDVVQLKSGSNLLTVHELSIYVTGTYAQCYYSDADGVPTLLKDIPVEVLQKVVLP